MERSLLSCKNNRKPPDRVYSIQNVAKRYYSISRFPTRTLAVKLQADYNIPRMHFVSVRGKKKKKKSKMASPFEGDGVRVLLTCSCSALSPPSRLYFCRHCIKLRCPLCVSHEVNLSQKPRVMVTI